MIQAQAGQPFDAILEGAPTGLEGTLGVRVVDPTTETTVVARTTAGIVEFPAGSGVYGVTLTAPALGANAAPWPVSVLWDTVAGGAPLTPGAVFTEDLLVYSGPPPAGVIGTDAPYFTVAEFRAAYPTLTADKYPDDKVEQTRLLAEEAFEDACDVAFVPRTAVDTVDADGAYIDLPHRRVRSISSAVSALDDAAIDVTGARVAGTAAAFNPAGWGYGYSQITVTYIHGHATPPRRVKQAVMILTRQWLIDGPISRRETQQVMAETGAVTNLSTPGLFGAEFGLPEVDQCVRRYREIGGLA